MVYVYNLQPFFFSGLLDAVRSLSSTANSTLISLTWEPPFTLDITGVDPDITGYCVDVVNSTSSATLYSECEITETGICYLFPPHRGCTVYRFTIAPVNVVGRGESSTTSYVESQTSTVIDDNESCNHQYRF